MKKFAIVILFFISIFFSRSYGMDFIDIDSRPIILNLKILDHIRFVSISRFLIQSSDFIQSLSSINREIFLKNVFTEEDGRLLYTLEYERLLYDLFINEEIKRLRNIDFNDYERLLINGSMLSIITVEEFDELFSDEEKLEELNLRRPHFLIKFIKKKLRFFRQVIEEKQFIEVDLSIIEEEDGRLDELRKKILKNRYHEEFSDFDDSEENGIFEFFISLFKAN